MHLAENFEESKPMKYMTKSFRPKNFVSEKNRGKNLKSRLVVLQIAEVNENIEINCKKNCIRQKNPRCGS